MGKQPWYKNGLQFQCTGCGDCCTGAPGFVWVNKAEIEALAATLSMPVDEFEARYVRAVGIRKSLVEHPNGDCIFFDGQKRQCTVYAVRPRQCRTWPFWQSNLETPENWQATAEGCPGCNQGKLYTLEEIQEQATRMRV